MVGFSKKMTERFQKIEQLQKEGKTKNEIVKYFFNKGMKKDKIYRTIASYEVGAVVVHSKPKLYGGRPIMREEEKNKQKLSSGTCIFCKKEKTIEHHVSYNPEITVNICVSCHSILHRIIEKYHQQITEKDSFITFFKRKEIRLKKLLEQKICDNVLETFSAEYLDK